MYNNIKWFQNKLEVVKIMDIFKVHYLFFIFYEKGPVVFILAVGILNSVRPPNG